MERRRKIKIIKLSILFFIVTAILGLFVAMFSGENFMIIGLPNEVFTNDTPRSETVIFMVPRIIRTLKTTETIKNKI